ncbi:low affinity iron permease family protein [Flavobacterium sp. RNTU_13]|uniref:low affinity iron permease family protein n=1 Tax=Flavobacterium sp. RNTU_13 TaxID=3375145 RepID=UPI003986E268
MNNESKRGRGSIFDTFATKVTQATGSTPVFVGAFSLVVIWGICGPIFNYSENWQLVINTGTTIITFLMVFLIQKAQNKDSLAIQIKLNELLASHKNASNRLVDIEDISEEEMKVIEKYYKKLGDLAEKDNELSRTHSIDDAEENQQIKSSARKHP